MPKYLTQLCSGGKIDQISQAKSIRIHEIHVYSALFYPFKREDFRVNVIPP